jgi:cytochrome oxidase Cu insertion factor (SCO1/SenC/PrrC family)
MSDGTAPGSLMTDRHEGLDARSNWLFLTGSTSELKSVLSAYGVAAIVTRGGGMVDHFDTAFSSPPPSHIFPVMHS